MSLAEKSSSKFKVIQQTKSVGFNRTKETTITIVPCLWESKGKLFWPSHLKPSQIVKLRKDPSSAPEKSWQIQDCFVKRYCDTYEEADKVSEDMSDTSETEADGDESSASVDHANKRPKRRAAATTSDHGFFKALGSQMLSVEICSPVLSTSPTRDQQTLRKILQQQTPPTKVQQQKTSPSTNSRLTANAQQQQKLLTIFVQQKQPSNKNQQHPAIISLKQSNKNQTKSSSTFAPSQYAIQSDGNFYNILQNAPIDNIDVYMDSNSITTSAEQSILQIPEGYILIKETLYDSILKVNASLSVKLDDIAELINKKAFEAINNTSIPHTSTSSAEIGCHHNPIKSDNQFRQSWLNYLCEIYGKDGQYKNNGIGCLNVLIDILFCRKFLTHCSWSGAARPEKKTMVRKILRQKFV